MLSTEEMKTYVEVVKFSNFTLAAKSLNITKQLVSRRIMAMEQNLGVRLLNRTTRKLSITEVGRVFYARCMQILQAIDEATQEITDQSSELRGLLRITAPVSFASMLLSPALNAFMLQHPLLDVSLDADNRTVDIIGEGYDIAIRITGQPDAGLIARKLDASPLIYCCSPSYVAQNGTPDNPRALRTHRCISQTSAEWIFKQEGEMIKMPIHAVLRSNQGEVMREAAIAGLGITGLPKFYVAEALNNGDLIQILHDFTPDFGNIYAMYPQHKQSSRMVRTFADHLQDWFKQS